MAGLQPNSDLSELGHITPSNSDKSEFDCHPRLTHSRKDVDARHEAGHDSNYHLRTITYFSSLNREYSEISTTAVSSSKNSEALAEIVGDRAADLVFHVGGK